MKPLKTFATSQKANLFAAYLGSEGIECTVHDDSSYGGDLMGVANPNTIRIDVAEEDFEDAKKLLDDYESPAPPKHVTTGKLETNRYIKIFRWLVIIDLLAYGISFIFYRQIYTSPPEDVQAYLNQFIISEDFYWATANLPFILTAFMVLSSLLMFSLLSLGRWLYAITTVLFLITYIGGPAHINGPLNGAFTVLQWILVGGVFAMSLMPPVSSCFRKRLTEGSDSV
ncbi:MAG: DUF2007 domain-containing protein [Verrucomicrobiota bacterium]